MEKQTLKQKCKQVVKAIDDDKNNIPQFLFLTKTLRDTEQKMIDEHIDGEIDELAEARFDAMRKDGEIETD